VQTDEGASRDRHLLTAAYSLVRVDTDLNAFGTVRPKASPIQANLKHY